MTTVNQIKQLLASGAITPAQDDVVKSGNLLAADGNLVPYTLHHGWDIAKCYACDTNWGTFNLSLFQYISDKKYSAEDLAKVLSEIQIDDRHWKWFDKACLHKDTTFNWFFLMAEGVPQGACVIYHPKKSVIQAGDIFYVEYIAVAPWNRINPMQKRRFKGIGTILVKHAIDYVTKTLLLPHGFSLHALPRASAWYQKIGMQRFVAHDKGQLQYFEMAENAAASFLEEA
jgi:hypothetical protein